MSKQQPYMPFFFGDFLASTARWKGEEQSLYMLLLAHQWAGGALPECTRELASMCRYEQKTFDKLWPKVCTKFQLTDAGWTNERLEQHREKAKEISEKRASAGAKGGSSKKQIASAKVVHLRQQNGSNCLANASGLYSHPIQSNPEGREEAHEEGGEV
jgi:uncharacterized protein YdaU (DUF1376 family)